MDFRQTLEASGLIPGHVEPDGNWHRCPTTDHPKKRNGAYKLATCGTIGFYQNHATESGVSTWRTTGTEKADPLISRARAIEALNESRRKLIESTQAARAFWSRCKPIRFGHPYLKAKLLGMMGCDGLRVDADGWLVVPVQIGTEIVSLQRIAPDGAKRFWTGAGKQGGCFIIQPRKYSLTVLCEGLGTGLAVYQSVPDCRVIVAFDCGNMNAVAQRLEISGLALVAADNDHATHKRIGKNPGIEHGKAAAELIGCGIAWPTNIQGSDYADMYCELIGVMTAANNSAIAKEKMRDADIKRMVSNEIAREIKRAAKFVPHARKEMA